MGATASGMGLGRWLYDRAYTIFLETFVYGELCPDWLTCVGIRYLLMNRVRDIYSGTLELQQKRLMSFVDEVKTMPIAVNTAEANEQHYEVDTEFYDIVLGARKKYSCALYPPELGSNRAAWDANLEKAEELMLATYCERAGLEDGMKVLDLGCGWGSVGLYVAERYPTSSVICVSNSNTQREYIMGVAKRRGFGNIQVHTGDINDFDFGAEHKGSFDRTISIEMFEHMKNYEALLAKVASWLRPGGRLFVHIFVHRLFAYHYTIEREDDWMSKYFFTGGTMPSDMLLSYFQRDLRLCSHWHVDGNHYAKTLLAWLHRMDTNRSMIMPVLRRCYGGSEANARIWWVRWRLFFYACAEIFALKTTKNPSGHEYFVSHYLFEKPFKN